MNERILELEKQAFDTVWDLDNDPIGPGTHFIPDGFEKKFAQLIVQECANFFAQRFEKAKMEGPTIYVDMTPEEIEREHCFYDGYLLALDNVGISLKEHFGVEE